MKSGIEPVAPTTSEFAQHRQTSRHLYERAKASLPGGISHNLRWTPPFPIYYRAASGAYKTDVDGNDYLDYHMASASQLIGHSMPLVVDAVRSQLEHTTGATACHELEIEWAEIVKQLVPCAERTRFTGSGTEATLLALRLARAATGRDKVVKFAGHYHGWHDYTMIGHRPPFDRPASAGVPASTLESVLVADLNDPVRSITELLARGDVAAVILEPTGASWGTAPLSTDTLRAIADATRTHGALLIFDEMVTGFRVSPGGAQTDRGVTPDLATLGKILCGGLPGGAVTGKAEIMDLLSPADFADENYVFHFGTFNANPLSAAAGVATLKAIANGEAHTKADHHALQLRKELSQTLDNLSIGGFVYGEASMFHMYLEHEASDSVRSPRTLKPTDYLGIPHAVITRLHLETRMRGVDLMSYNGGVSSASHGDIELERAILALEGALRVLRDERLITGS